MRRRQMVMEFGESKVEEWKRRLLGAYDVAPCGFLYGRPVDVQLSLKMQNLRPKILVYLALNTRTKNLSLLSPKYKAQKLYYT